MLKWLQVLAVGSAAGCVTDWVQSTFDCYVAPLRVPPYRLAVLAAEWVAMGEFLRGDRDTQLQLAQVGHDR